MQVRYLVIAEYVFELTLSSIVVVEMLLASVPKNVSHESSIQKQLHKLRLMKAEKSAGNAAFRAGRYERAYEKYTASINVDSNADEYNSVLYCNRAAAAMAMGQFEKAISDCAKALELNKDYEKVRVTLLWCGWWAMQTSANTYFPCRHDFVADERM